MAGVAVDERVGERVGKPAEDRRQAAGHATDKLTPTTSARRWLDRRVIRLDDGPPWVTVTRIFIGLGWLRAAAEKAISVDWWTGDTIAGFVVDHQTATLPWMRPVADLALTATPLFIIGVITAQLFVALALITHRHLTVGLVTGMLMNLGFLAIGAVNPSAFYLLTQGSLLLWVVGRQRRRPTTSTSSSTSTVPITISTKLRVTSGAAVVLATISLPFVQTLHPALVIDDPAVMIATLCGLAALACDLTHRRLHGVGLT